MEEKRSHGFELGVGLVVALGSLGCFYAFDDGSYVEKSPTSSPSGTSLTGGYHGQDAVRQSLVAPAPELPARNPGYDDDAGGDWWASCTVHAECPADRECVSDPACPEYQYCEPIDCGCTDRFNTVCWEGLCVMRGVDCKTGCPENFRCDELGVCVCDDPSCAAYDVPDAGDCPSDFECGSWEVCIAGDCVEDYVPCESDVDCQPTEVCGFFDRKRACIEPGVGSIGAPCGDSTQCKTGYCADGSCSLVCAKTADCHDDQQCLSSDTAWVPHCGSPICDDCGAEQICYGQEEGSRCVYR